MFMTIFIPKFNRSNIPHSFAHAAFEFFGISFATMMMCSVLAKIGYFQITDSVVKFISVDMVYNFFRFKISSQMFFHNKSVFSKIACSIGKRMIRSVKKTISSPIRNASLPLWMVRTADGFSLKFNTASNRTYFSTTVRNSPIHNLKRMITYFAFSIYPTHIPIIIPI